MRRLKRPLPRLVELRLPVLPLVRRVMMSLLPKSRPVHLRLPVRPLSRPSPCRHLLFQSLGQLRLSVASCSTVLCVVVAGGFVGQYQSREQAAVAAASESEAFKLLSFMVADFRVGGRLRASGEDWRLKRYTFKIFVYGSLLPSNTRAVESPTSQESESPQLERYCSDFLPKLPLAVTPPAVAPRA